MMSTSAARPRPRRPAGHHLRRPQRAGAAARWRRCAGACEAPRRPPPRARPALGSGRSAPRPRTRGAGQRAGEPPNSSRCRTAAPCACDCRSRRCRPSRSPRGRSIPCTHCSVSRFQRRPCFFSVCSVSPITARTPVTVSSNERATQPERADRVWSESASGPSATAGSGHRRRRRLRADLRSVGAKRAPRRSIRR